MATVAINGFGRIGRTTLRAMNDEQRTRVVAINDVADASTLAHLFKFDSTRGPFEGAVESDRDSIVINGHRIAVCSEPDPSRLPWGKLGADIIVESTGHFNDREKAAKHIDAGAKKVVISSAGIQPDLSVVYGINHDHYEADRHHLIGAGFGVSPCVTALAKVLNDHFGIEWASLTGVASYISDQNLIDAPSRSPRRSRSAAQNVIITDGAYCGANLGFVIPELAGKVMGTIYRVPTPVGCVIEMVAQVRCHVSPGDINHCFLEAANGPLAGIIEYCDEPIVLRDVIGNPHSCVFNSISTLVCDDKVKVVGWLDNEWGYVARLVDLVEWVGQRL